MYRPAFTGETWRLLTGESFEFWGWREARAGHNLTVEVRQVSSENGLRICAGETLFAYEIGTQEADETFEQHMSGQAGALLSFRAR